jgi:5S rRNA maturation endonuclease (ribonuclease M5)
MTFEEILVRFEAKRQGASFMAKCPSHEDRKPSLSITEKNGKTLLKCHAGCDTRDVVAAIGLTLEDLREGTRHVSTYDYVDENGILLFQCLRYEPKAFKLRHPDGKGGWTWNLNGTRRVIYNLPAVLTADSVLIVEGEKDVEAARQLGLVGTCNPMGAGKWREEYGDSLRGKNITIIPDSDEPGRKHAEQIAASLAGKVKSVAICHLPEGIKDLSEWPQSKESLVDLINKAPARKPEQVEVFDTRREFDETAEPTFSIDGFLQDYAVTAIAGLSGNSKTWVALSTVKGLLFGPGKLWDLFDVPDRAKKVIYLIPEASRSVFKKRLLLMGLYDEIGQRLFVRTMTKGPTLPLADPALLREMKNAHVVCDTAIRFMKATDENSASEAAQGLSEDFFTMLRAEARTIAGLFHSPKSFTNQNSMSLENMIRGSGEFGAVLATGWGIRQIDKAMNTIHVENIKDRDFKACAPFELQGRPYIDETGDFQLLNRPGDCGELNLVNEKRAEQKGDRVGMVAEWLRENGNLTNVEIAARFAATGISVTEDTAYRYKVQARKRTTP